MKPRNLDKEKLLGLGSEITRRDFVGSSLRGSGAVLLGMCAPGLVAGAQPDQMINAPLTGLDANWTGPGGLGDYGRANGNTHLEINAGHAVRNAEFGEQLSTAEDSGEILDMVVVGGGFSGLTAAYNFNQQRPGAFSLILENHAILEDTPSRTNSRSMVCICGRPRHQRGTHGPRQTGSDSE